MSEEQKEKIKKIAKLRAMLKKRVENMETELDELKTLMELLDTTLLKESFKRAAISKPVQRFQEQKKKKPSLTRSRKNGTPLKTVTGDLLAQIFAEKDDVKIVFAEDKNFDINTPPFTSFFIERVLTKMKEKDIDDANIGKLDPEKIMSFVIKQDGNKLKEMHIKNLRSDRIRELKSSIRWTLEKMFERMKQKN